MVASIVGRARRAPYPPWTRDREAGQRSARGRRVLRVLLRIGLIALCTLVILAVVLVPVASGGPVS